MRIVTLEAKGLCYNVYSSKRKGITVKKSVVLRKQINVRLKPHNIDLMNRAAVVLDMTQAQVIEQALEMFAKRKRINVEEGCVS